MRIINTNINTQGLIATLFLLLSEGSSAARLRRREDTRGLGQEDNVPEQVCNDGDGTGVELFNIQIVENVVNEIFNENEYLSANNVGPGVNPSVTRSVQDDDSGRQKWRLLPVPSFADTYYIVVAGGIDNEDYVYLSYPLRGPSNRPVDLHNEDDGSGRQKWVVRPVGGEDGEVLIQSVYSVFDIMQGDVQPYLQPVTQYGKEDGGALVTNYNVEVSAAENPQPWRLRPTGCNSNDITSVVDFSDGIINPSPGTPLADCPNNLYHVSIAGGTSGGFGGEQLLSASHNGLDIDLYSHDDGSGRQRWRILNDSDGPSYYTIQVSEGTVGGHSGAQLLSVNEDGSIVDLYSDNDFSGRQLWNLIPIIMDDGSWHQSFHIEISGGVTGGTRLTANEDGSDLVLATDLDLQRQEWIIECIQ